MWTHSLAKSSQRIRPTRVHSSAQRHSGTNHHTNLAIIIHHAITTNWFTQKKKKLMLVARSWLGVRVSLVPSCSATPRADSSKAHWTHSIRTDPNRFPFESKQPRPLESMWRHQYQERECFSKKFLIFSFHARLPSAQTVRYVAAAIVSLIHLLPQANEEVIPIILDALVIVVEVTNIFLVEKSERIS